MKKNYFMLVCLVLLSAFTAKAQVNSVADLFGDYRFTADVEFTEAGQSYKDILSGDCDAKIEADATYSARIIGFAGSQVQQNINAISTEQNKLKVLNLNNPALWNNGLMLANENGDNPYGVWNSETSNWDVESYGPVYYTFDPATKEISIPDFTVITMSDYSAAKGNVIAKYTNVKMTLVESATIEVADVSGEWNFKAGSGAYDTMEGSVFPTEFTVALAKNGDDNRAYTATVAIEGYNSVEMPATFDGNTLALSYDDLAIDAENGIRFAPMYGSSKKGTIEFKSQSETSFTLYSGFSFASDKMGKAKDEVTDSLYVNGEYHQWYIAGTLKKPSEAPAFTWDGTWNVKVASASDVIPCNADVDVSLWPAEFEMQVTYYEAIDAYYVDKLMGYDLYGVNQGGLVLTPNEDGTASVALDGYYGCAFLAMNEDGTFLQLTNSSATTEPLKLTMNEDGSIKIDDIFVQILDFNTGAQTPVVYYQNMTATKAGAEEPVFDWVGDYSLKAGVVDVYYQGAVEFPAEFNVKIEYFDGSEYDMDSFYFISEFMGKELGQTVIDVVVAEDGNSAEMVVGGLCGAITPGELYYKIYDMNATTSPVKMTVNADGTVSIDNFFIKVYNYNDKSETAGAFYKEVVLTKNTGETSIEQIVENEAVEGIFDIQGRRVDAVTAPGLYIVNGKKVLVK